MSRWEPTLRELAMEPDEDKRLEMAASLDREAEELDERYANRDGYAEIEAERDRIAAERDEAIVDRDTWRTRYADRFFGGRETDPEEVKRQQVEDVKRDGQPQSFRELFVAREG